MVQLTLRSTLHHFDLDFLKGHSYNCTQVTIQGFCCWAGNNVYNPPCCCLLCHHHISLSDSLACFMYSQLHVMIRPSTIAQVQYYPALYGVLYKQTITFLTATVIPCQEHFNTQTNSRGNATKNNFATHLQDAIILIPCNRLNALSVHHVMNQNIAGRKIVYSVPMDFMSAMNIASEYITLSWLVYLKTE